MKILTWNINGIRASKRSLKDVLDSLDADVICLQETKITRDMMDEPSAIVDGYNAYFSFSRKRSGYSGTANFCRDAATPNGAEEGLSGQLTSQSEGSIGCHGNLTDFEDEELRSLDGEGRAVLTQHQIDVGEGGGVREVVIINVYVPRAAAEREDRVTYKLRFLALLQNRAESLLRHGKHVIVLGDINTTHKRIDHCDPSSQEYLRAHSRKWLDQFLRPEDRDPDLSAVDENNDALLPGAEGGRFIDAFRFFHPERTEAYTNWCTVTAARQTNYGRRLDYIFVDRGLREHLRSCVIMADFEGSDHCPVVLELSCPGVPASRCPPLCSKHMPEFSGKQQKLLSFFSAKSTTAVPVHEKRCGDGNGDRNSSSSAMVVGKKVEGDSEDKGEQKCQALVSSSSLSLLSSSSSSSSSTSQLQHCGRAESVDGKKKQSPQKSAMKRSSSNSKLSDDSSSSFVAKKKKPGGKGDKGGGGAGGKQGNLLNFFRKTPSLPTAAATTTTTTTTTSTTTTNLKSSAGSEDSKSSSTSTSSSPTPSPSKQWLSSLTLIPEERKESVMHSQEAQTSQSSKLSDNTSAAATRPSENGSCLDFEQGRATHKQSSQQAQVRSENSERSRTEQNVPSGGSGTRESVHWEGSRSEETGHVQGGQQSKAKCAWSRLLSGPPPAPPCKGHAEPCVLRTVKKAGPTKGRQFYVCARPEGHSSNKDARCDHFQWVNYMAGGKSKGKT